MVNSEVQTGEVEQARKRGALNDRRAECRIHLFGRDPGGTSQAPGWALHGRPVIAALSMSSEAENDEAGRLLPEMSLLKTFPSPPFVRPQALSVERPRMRLLCAVTARVSVASTMSRHPPWILSDTHWAERRPLLPDSPALRQGLDTL